MRPSDDAKSTASARRAGASPPRSALALASLICALLACVPLVTSLAATIVGALALRRIRLSSGRLGGRRIALAGTLLGSAGVVLWLGGLSWTGHWYRGVLEAAMTQRVKSFLALAAEQPSAAAAEGWSIKATRAGAMNVADIERLGDEARLRYGRLLEFSIISETTTGTTFAPELDVAATFRFERGEQLGAARFEVIPGAASLIPQVRLLRLRIEDTDAGDLLIPAEPAPPPVGRSGG